MQVLTDLPIQHLRHQGMIFAFDVITNNSQFSKQFYQAAIKHGVLLRPIGSTIYFMPPYTISTSEIDFILQATVKALQETV
jgi:adenosylmethionine-8-amino-7-oxononanoate aminotransferase